MRHASAARVRQCLKTNCDVHPVTQEVATLDHHVTNMDPYAKVERELVVRTLVQVAQGLLNLPSAHDSVNSAGELS
nr:hypothetical protein [Microvirga aerilata]